jgi:hypothetical protein
MHDWLIPTWAICWPFAGQGDKNPIKAVAYKIQR